MWTIKYQIPSTFEVEIVGKQRLWLVAVNTTLNNKANLFYQSGKLRNVTDYDQNWQKRGQVKLETMSVGCMGVVVPRKWRVLKSLGFSDTTITNLDNDCIQSNIRWVCNTWHHHNTILPATANISTSETIEKLALKLKCATNWSSRVAEKASSVTAGWS